MSKGFTLIELMVTLAVLAILLTVAVPGLAMFVQNNRLAAQANDLVTALAYARSEAVSRAVRVAVCGRQDDLNCTGSGIWDGGFLVFVDADGNGAPDGAGDILRVRAPMEGANTLRSNRAVVTFQPSGFSTGSNATVNLCDTRGDANGRAIILNNQGRVRVAAVTAGGCP